MKKTLFKIMLLAFFLNHQSFTMSMSEEISGNSLVERLKRRTEIAGKYGEDVAPSSLEVARDYISNHQQEAEAEFIDLLLSSFSQSLNPQAEESKIKLIELFISAGINLLNTKKVGEEIFDALLAAVEGQNISIVNVIIKALYEKEELNFSINRTLADTTPLMTALLNYHRSPTPSNKKINFEILNLLLENGANPDLNAPKRPFTYAEFVHRMAGKQGSATQDRDERLMKLFDKYRKKWD